VTIVLIVRYWRVAAIVATDLIDRFGSIVTAVLGAIMNNMRKA
jgi:hypothetical protein